MDTSTIKIWELKSRTVYETRDYNMFKMILGNRVIRKKHVDELKRKIIESGLFMSPIVVNEKYEIIDGQHRYTALKELGLPVSYVVIEGIGIRECIVMNSVSSNWNALDYLNSYADNDYEGYVRIRRVYEQFKNKGITLNNVLMATTGKSRPSDAFKFGNITMNAEGEEYAWELLNFASDVMTRMRSNGVKPKDTVLNAVIFAYQVPDLDQQRLLNTIDRNVDGRLSEMRECSSIKGCLKVMGEMYSKGFRKTTGPRRVIHLETEYDAVSDVSSWYGVYWGWNDGESESSRKKKSTYTKQTSMDI